MFKRIALFALTNLLVVVTVSFLLNLLGVGRFLGPAGINYGALMAFCLVWGFAGAFISLALSRLMAKWMMGVEVIDPANPGRFGDLVDLVHGLAREAGLPALPEVGVYPSAEPNAFATGPTRSRALVAVSTGLLQRMDRAQLQGVLGHEIAHVANGDMVTLTLIQGVINAFVMFFARVLAYAISTALSSRDEREERVGNPFVYWMVTQVLEVCLSFLGFMVVAWFSRQREFRADAGGARFAGREKMISALRALQRLHELPAPAEAQGAGQGAFQAFKISGRGQGWMGLFSTHPPLEDRIARLEGR